MLFVFHCCCLLEHEIDISCLTLITDDMLKEIIPIVGHRAKFRANLEEWRKVIALANDQITLLVSIFFIFIYFHLPTA